MLFKDQKTITRLAYQYTQKQAGSGGISSILFNMYKKSFMDAAEESYDYFYTKYNWSTVEGLTSKIQPGLWDVTSKYGGTLINVSYHVDFKKITINCNIQNYNHKMVNQRLTTPLDYFFNGNMDKEHIKEHIKKFIFDCAKKNRR